MTVLGGVVVNERFKRLLEGVQRWGWLRVLHQRLMRTLGPRFRMHWAMVRQLQRPSPADVVVPQGFALRVPTVEELEKAARNPDLQLSRKFLRSACARNDLCVAAFKGDSLVAYTWRAHQTCPHASGIWVEFPLPYRYGYKALTLPECRGVHLQSALARFSDELSLARGATLGLSFIECHNYSSLALAKRMGGRPFGISGWVRIFGRTWTFRSAALRSSGIGFVYRGGDAV